ncbi:MAG: hypothetical protein A2Z14_18235 [Chloroflexi bacterium RBG_16_48_8]|nr:MAG: hypothetical protein A2Z14_18235 [Chloroflexi bacterium RBG_16_48_8]
MSPGKTPSKNPFQICTWQNMTECGVCSIETNLNCRFDWGDLAYFAAIFSPPAITAVIGMLLGGFGWYLLGWAGYAIFFFFVWEARILCCHCPFWAEESRVLHCLANYGVIKIWRYHPEPMSRSEQAQFLIGAGILVLYPLPFLILGEQYLLTVILLVGLISFWFSLKKHVCSHCVNFSCPLNGVPKSIVDVYLQRNPMMRLAWEARGYRLDPR